MQNITRLLATVALSCSLTAAAAPSAIIPKPDADTATSAKAVIAHSLRPGVDCPTRARDNREQRAERLATLMMRHSMVSRMVPGRGIAESAREAVRDEAAQRHDDTPRSCG